VYLRTLSLYLDSSFLIVILRIQLELICWATTPLVVITLLTLRITYTPSPLTGPTVVLAIRFRYTKAAFSYSKGVIRKASGKATLDNNPILNSIVNSVNNGDNADDELDIKVLVKDIAVNNNTFRATTEDLVYILGQIRAELPNDNVLTPNYSY